VTNAKSDGRDSNDNVIDRITGQKVNRPGDEPANPDVKVPMPKAPTPEEVNRPDPAAPENTSKPAAKAKGKGKGDKPALDL
jgi:hypothetical protein